jgi:hypothetical protein
MMALIASVLSAIGAYAICYVWFQDETAKLLISHLNYREAVAMAVFIIVLRGYGNSK